MLELGQAILHYRVLEKIGQGGMGEVYQAKDQKLGRDVAIKVLPEEFSKDADRVARFQREAKLLASLNHSNIAAIHGLEESEGTNFLVLEFVEGDTLADQIKKGPVPVEEALKLALQIAEALEAAHEKGVIHRDLKPANIKVTPEGKVKVLDFGLAKAFAGDREDVNLSNSPTLSNAATQQGLILGTAAYMSPEQARGKPVDKRADIWAFGCILFEMLTGRAVFSGRDVTEILAAVIRAEPEWKILPSNLHWRIREALEHCLNKDSGDRYHDIADVRIDIQKALADPDGVLIPPSVTEASRKRLQGILPWIASVVVLIAIIAGAVVWKMNPSEPRLVTRFDCDLPDGRQLGNTIYALLSVSADGRRFVYCAGDGLYMRSMNELKARLIKSADDNPSTPFFSPDGQWIGYWSMADNKLKKIAISGGAPIPLCDVGIVIGGSWYAEDAIIYTESKGIMRISADGGTPETLIERNEDEWFYHARLLPDGRSVIFTLGPSPYRIAVQSLETRKRKVLFEGDNAWYLPTGHIVYALANELFVVPFQPDTLEFGLPVQIIGDVYRSSHLYMPHYCVSDSGTLVYVPEIKGAAKTARNLLWVDREGKEELLAAPPKDYRAPRISPDGNRVALSLATEKNEDIWIWDRNRKDLKRLTSNGAMNVFPLWAPDGNRIYFSSNRTGTFRLYWKAADGTEEEVPLNIGPVEINRFPITWSDRGKALILVNLFYQYGVGVLSMEGEHAWKPLLSGSHNEGYAHISPDGRWMAYVSNESGQDEVYVRPFPDVNKGEWKVSTGGGSMPLWSPDGRELFYRSGDSVLSVLVKTDPTFNAGAPETLFRGNYVSLSPNGAEPWDISPDGKRFLMMKESSLSSGEGPRKISVVLNWFEELKQKVPKK